MKLSKTEFKGMLKECLSELINEGAFDKHLGNIVESKISSGGTNGPITLKEGMTKFDAKEYARNLTKDMILPKDPRLAAAFLQTAEELPNKLMLENGLRNSEQMMIDEQKADLELNALSGGDIKRWAAAAFSGKKNI